MKGIFKLSCFNAVVKTFQFHSFQNIPKRFPSMSKAFANRYITFKPKIVRDYVSLNSNGTKISPPKSCHAPVRKP